MMLLLPPSPPRRRNPISACPRAEPNINTPHIRLIPQTQFPTNPRHRRSQLPHATHVVTPLPTITCSLASPVASRPESPTNNPCRSIVSPGRPVLFARKIKFLAARLWSSICRPWNFTSFESLRTAAWSPTCQTACEHCERWSALCFGVVVVAVGAERRDCQELAEMGGKTRGRSLAR